MISFFWSSFCKRGLSLSREAILTFGRRLVPVDYTVQCDWLLPQWHTTTPHFVLNSINYFWEITSLSISFHILTAQAAFIDSWEGTLKARGRVCLPALATFANRGSGELYNRGWNWMELVESGRHQRCLDHKGEGSQERCPWTWGGICQIPGSGRMSRKILANSLTREGSLI
jgi:hypothetical protein